ncbi:MAG TPA: AAA family ATPase [Actinomycetota bacterium]|nr:AAA family ATPase [Actinomycetota bacterium]
MPGRQSSPEIVGRAEEMDCLGQALDRAAGGRGGALIVSGEAGVGKTRLLTEFVAARCTGATVLVGACLALADGAPPYWPVIDALRSLRLADAEPALAAIAAPGPAARALGEPVLAAAPLAPPIPAGPLETELGTEPPPSGPPGGAPEPARRAQDHVFEPVLRTIEQASALGPVVLMVEDLHWSDRSTRDLLTFLIGNLRRQPFLFVGTYRSDALVPGHALHAWLAELLRGAEAELIELPRLSRQAMTSQLGSILGAPVRPDIVEAIWARSEGNAFFAEELLAAMVAGQEELPPTLRQVLLARIGSLSPAATRLLAMVAATGSPVRHELLAALTHLPQEDLGVDLMRAIRECVDQQVLLVDPRGGYTFRHSLLREAVEEQLLPAERIALHRACARVLTADRSLAYGSAAVELAWHWYAAGDHANALPAAVEAAVAAESSFGFAEACAHLERALQLWETGSVPDVPGAPRIDGLELRMRAAECANLAGDHARAAAHARAATAALGRGATAPNAALVWERLGRYLWDSGASEDALVAYERAVELVAAGSETPVAARVVGAQAGALMLAGHYGESRRRAEEALDLARRTGSRREEAQVLGVLGFDLAYLGDPGGVALLHEARRIAEEDGDADGVARAYLHLATLLSEPLNRLEEAVVVAEEGLARVRTMGLVRFHGATLQAMIANTLFRLGRWDEGERRVREAFDANPAGTAVMDLRLARAKITMARGDFAATAGDLEAVKELSIRAIDPRFTVPVLTLEAGLALWEGRLDDARDAVAAGLAKLTVSQEVWFAAPLAWHGLRTEADRAEQARGRRGTEDVVAARSTAEGLLTHLRGLIGRLDPAAAAVHRAAELYAAMCEGERSRLEGASSAETWESVATTWDAMGQPYPAAYARWRTAEALLARRARSGTAAEALRSAHAVALTLGANPLRREVEGLAARAGIALDAPARPAPAAPSAPQAPEANLGLTRREVEVLRLVAMGRTNREVATILFISEKTAGVHVSNILRKLGLRSRVEASGYAHRLGLLDDPAQN